MDGISVAASIVGLLSAAVTISKTLNDFIARVKEAPKLATTVLCEVADTSTCLRQVQSLLLRADTSRASNRSFLMVEDLIVVLSNCVLVFSELEKLVDDLKPEQSIRASDILRWTMKEKTVAALLFRLHTSKTSLNLMISALTFSSITDVQSSVDQLGNITRQLVDSNHDISERLSRMESKNSDALSAIASTAREFVGSETSKDDESIITVRSVKAGSSTSKTSEMSMMSLPSEFESLLESSRPYRRAFKRSDSSLSATSSVIHTLGWSFLSGISLAEVSNISIIELALDKNKIWNSIFYDTAPHNLGKLFAVKWSELHENSGVESGQCQECNKWIDERFLADYFFEKLWHPSCVCCTNCGISWVPSRGFYEYHSLTCANCLPQCLICRFRSPSPFYADEGAFCLPCIMNESPCEVCGNTVLNPESTGWFTGNFCCHQRNLLLQRAPHMKDFFYPRDQSLSKSRRELDLVVAEVDDENNSLLPLPRGRLGKFVTENESLLDELSSNTIVGPKDFNYITDITVTTTDTKVPTDKSKRDGNPGRSLMPPEKTTFPQPATRLSIGPKHARTRRTSMIRTPFGPKKQGSNELGGNRTSYSKRISAPILLENSLGWM